MNYIWDYVLKAEEAGFTEKDIVFLPAKEYSPYMELALEDINTSTFLEKGIEINPYYRYYHIFKDLFHKDNLENLELRQELFDIVIHHLLRIDRYMGMNRDEFFVLFLKEDIEEGCFGRIEKERMQLFSKSEQKMYLHHLVILYQIGDSLTFFQMVLSLFYHDLRLYENTLEKEEVLIYLGIHKNEREEAKINLLVDTFLPIRYEYRIYWNYHFGIIGMEETMKLNQIQLY